MELVNKWNCVSSKVRTTAARIRQYWLKHSAPRRCMQCHSVGRVGKRNKTMVKAYVQVMIPEENQDTHRIQDSSEGEKEHRYSGTQGLTYFLNRVVSIKCFLCYSLNCTNERQAFIYQYENTQYIDSSRMNT